MNNPAFTQTARPAGCPAIRASFTAQIISYSIPSRSRNRSSSSTNVGTFDPANPIEIRQNGAAPLGAAGFNGPALLGVDYSAPYFHDGGAQTLEEVFELHQLPGGEDLLSGPDGRPARLPPRPRRPYDDLPLRCRRLPRTGHRQPRNNDPMSGYRPRRSWKRDRRGHGASDQRGAQGPWRCQSRRPPVGNPRAAVRDFLRDRLP